MVSGVNSTLLDLLMDLSTGAAVADDVLERHMENIRKLNSVLHAFITVFDKPLRVGDYGKRPLMGASVAVKDLIYVKGYPTTAGSKILRNFIPNYSGKVVERLVAKGATIHGKTNLHEFAFGVTNKNPHYGDCMNPWKGDRISGGSSGGSAVAVACGMAAAALGTDTAGSIRIPSSFCGVYGFKPTYGLISRNGVIPLSWSLDHVGYLGRSIRDLAFLTGLTSDKPISQDLTDFSKSFKPVEIKRLRVGVPRKHFLDHVEEDVSKNFDRTISTLESEGAIVRDVVLPNYSLFRDCRHLIVHAEAAAFHMKMFRERSGEYGEDVRRRLLEGMTIPATSYITALRVRSILLEQFRGLFKDVDILAMPTTVITAPRLDATSVEVGGAVLDIRAATLRNTEVFNVVGAPALSMPNGFSRDGLPTSLQLVSDLNTDWGLLEIAASLEELIRPSVTP
ncbi:MAG: amidase [Nitrososphaerota archaeon]